MHAAARQVVLQLGFGLGQAFLQAWRDWQEHPAPATQLDFIALTPTPPTAEALRQAHRGTAWQPQAEALAMQWPPLTRNLHRLSLAGGKMHLLLGVGDALDLLPELKAQVNDFLIDEVTLLSDPQRAPLRLCKGLARLAAPGASLRAAAGLQALRPPLSSAGFKVQAGTTEIRAVYQPRFTPRRRGRPSTPSTERHVLIVGAGLAGCATAWALADQGWRSTLIDRADAPATEGSGNPAGLFHGIVNPQDGAHARFNRAAALLAQRTVQTAIDGGTVLGNARGLLRLDTRDLTVQALRDELARLQLPADYVQALDAAQASARCGLPLQHSAWFYPGGGWVQPAALAHWFLQQAGTLAGFRGHLKVLSLREAAGRWQLLDAAGQVIAEAGNVVLANASDALRLLAASHWPVLSVRGQISLIRAAAAEPSLALPKVPLAGTGYLLPDINGQAVFGASSQPGDTDGEVREADQVYNLQRLAQLSPALAGLQPSQLQGRVAWRCVTDDRLPLVGAVPDEAAFGTSPGERLDQVPRRPGLYAHAALGSRGISWAALGAQVLAAQISGAPVPLESSLVDALDPARFALRAARRALPRG